MKKQLIAAAVAVALGSSIVSADDTTSTIRGQIFNPNGQPANNVTIIVTHEPTGTTRTFTTNESGTFVASGLRVGGPYTVLIDSNEFTDKSLEQVYLSLSEPFQLRETLADDENKITVTAQAIGRYPNSGSNSTFTAAQIQDSPNFDRDLKGVLRRNPLVNVLDNDVGSLSVAGANPRYNSLVVDGVRQDDDFGLNGSGFPTQRSPISIDAIEQISVVTNPFNPRFNGFSGAQINVVTKSGTNEFQGRVFYEYGDDKFAGTAVNNGQEVPREFTERVYGFNVGGPIVENNLFFFASFEKYEGPGGEINIPGSTAANGVSITEQDALDVIRIARDVYGVDAGRWDDGRENTDEKIQLKLDWEISDTQRALFSYQNTDGQQTARTNSNEDLRLSSHWYTRGDELTTYTLQWYSDWSSDFSTEIRVSDKESTNLQRSLGSGFGQVTVATPNGDIFLGPDRSRHANQLNNDTFQFLFHGEYLADDHKIEFGVVRDEIDVFNIFIQDALGSWEFDSIADFENRIASDFNYQNANTNIARDGGAEFSIATNAIYLSDTWDITEDLSLSLGVRYEQTETDDAPTRNQNFVTRNGFGNDASLDGKDLTLPRIGFNYIYDDELTIRGGIGDFSGGRPNVWLSNAYSNDGSTIVRFNPNDIADPSTYLTNVDITQVAQNVQDTLTTGDGNATPIDPNFQIPKIRVTSLAFDLAPEDSVFGDNVEYNMEFIYRDNVRDVQWIDLSREQIGTTGSGRPIYQVVDPVTNNPDRWDLLLTNAEGGRSFVSTFSFNKAWQGGMNLNLSYTNQDIKDRVPGTSSTAQSNFQFTTVVDRQNPGVATAAYEIEHRLALNFDYQFELVDGYESRIGVVAERVSGRPFSWTMGAFRDDDLGDQNDFDDSDVYLPYIPTGPNDPAVDFVNGLSYNEIIANLRARGIDTAGGYLGRNAYRGPYRTNIDLTFSQEIGGITEGGSGQVYFIIDNLLNLIDSSQGKIFSNRFGENQQILFDYDINAQGQYVYQNRFGGGRTNSPAVFRPIESAYRVKLGVRYDF